MHIVHVSLIIKVVSSWSWSCRSWIYN